MKSSSRTSLSRTVARRGHSRPNAQRPEAQPEAQQPEAQPEAQQTEAQQLSDEALRALLGIALPKHNWHLKGVWLDPLVDRRLAEEVFERCEFVVERLKEWRLNFACNHILGRVKKYLSAHSTLRLRHEDL